MVAFKGGNNTGGQNVDYYDNPNYDPKNEGKSKIDKALKDAAQSAAWAEESNRQYYNVGIDYDYVVEAEGQAAYDKSKADKQASETVSYFRAKERERLNPSGIGGPQINPKFSQPATSKLGKLAKFGMSFDAEDPDSYYDQAQKVPQGQLTENLYDTSRKIGNYDYFEETSRYAKGTPMPKTVAGVNQELQAVKARTRDAAMTFRGMVFDFIDDVTTSMENSINFDDLENKYFPNDEWKKAARNELRNMIGFTDEASDITRGYSSATRYAEEIALGRVSDHGEDFSKFMNYGISPHDSTGINTKVTEEKYKKSLSAYSQWKAKKGVPKIVRLINKLP